MSQKKSEITDTEWVDMILALETCEEAVECLDEFFQCPVCGANVNEDGYIIHKDPERYVN